MLMCEISFPINENCFQPSIQYVACTVLQYIEGFLRERNNKLPKTKVV